MYKLNLKTGQRVKNIRVNSSRLGWHGVVMAVPSDSERIAVQYDNGIVQYYLKKMAHTSLRPVYGKSPIEDLDYSELEARVVAHVIDKQYHFETFPLAYRDCAMMPIEHRDNALKALLSLGNKELEKPRRTLSKVRRNVITGMTQCQMQKQHGYARGTAEFNSRAVGTTTGQALRCISEAMLNPGIKINIKDVDHAISSARSRSGVNEHFRQMVTSLIHAHNFKGFDIQKDHITFNPIVTEETYVEVR